MEYKISHDSMGTHIDWNHEGVTAREIDWFWSNMEKGFILWHPEQHEALEWAVPPKHGNPIGSIHIAPQTWSDGRRQNLYIRFEKLEDVAPAVARIARPGDVVITLGAGSIGTVPDRLLDLLTRGGGPEGNDGRPRHGPASVRKEGV